MKSLAKYRKKGGQQGFTLVELTVVLAIMGMIAAMSVPNLMSEINEKRANITIQDSQAILDAARAYRLATGSWPGNATCTNAITFLSSTTPPYLGGIGANNKYNSPYSTSCNGLTFTLRQNIAQDWDGVVANGLTGTRITNAATFQVSSVIGIPGSEPALDGKLSRGNVGNPELNRMRTTLHLGHNNIDETANISMTNPWGDSRITAQNNRLILGSNGSRIVAIENGTTLDVENVTLRQRGGARLIDLLPNYVQKGTYSVYHGWGVIKPSCNSNAKVGYPKASLRQGTMLGGYNDESSAEGVFGYSYRLINRGTWWEVYTPAWGNSSMWSGNQSLVDVYCYYP